MIIGPFGGPVTAIDAEFIDPMNSADELNMSHEDGRLRPRRGYRNLDGIPTNWVSIHGLDYIQGYNASNALVEEFLTAERLSTYSADKCRIFSRNILTGAETEVKNGVTSVDLTTTGYWRPFAWRDVAYICNKEETTSVYRHAIGDATSLVAFAVPTAPTTPLTYRIDLASGGSSQYAMMGWAGIAFGDVTVTGSARATDATDVILDGANGFKISHDHSSGSAASWEVDLSGITANVQDWTYNDVLYFTLTPQIPAVFGIDPSSIEVTLTNNDGSPKIFVPQSIQAIEIDTGTSMIGVRVQFEKITRAEWDNIKKFKVAYRCTKFSQATQDNNFLKVSAVTLGCCVNIPPVSANPATPQMIEIFGYSYLANATSLESGVAGEVLIPRSAFEGLRPHPLIDPLGAWITLTMTDSADTTVDNYRIYWHESRIGDISTVRNWRRIVTQSDATDTYAVKMSNAELMALTLYYPNPFKTDGCVAGFAFRGWVVWLYKGGFQNVRHSRIGLPESQYSDFDSPTDPNRGAVFSMSDNFGDEPLGGCQCDEACMLAGSQGIYAQLGIRPSEMDPPKKLAGSFGCPNPYGFTRFQMGGQAAVAALAKDGEGLYAYIVHSNFDGESGFEIVELTQSVRPSLKDFLMTPQSLTSFDTARVVYEPNTDALWIIMGVRAMKLPRASVATGKREWEFYRFGIDSAETISFAAASVRTRMKWFRSHGKFDEVEWNATTLAYITGSLRDGGNAMPSPYWTSKIFKGARRRILWIDIERETSTDTPAIQIISTEATNSYTFASTKRWIKGKIAQIGQEHQFKITLAEASGYVKNFEVYESKAVGARRRVA